MGMVYVNVFMNDNRFVMLHRENRYLLFLTENYAALEILKQYLHDQEGGHPAPSDQSEGLKPWEMEPYVLFGSSFPKDKEYTQVSVGTGVGEVKLWAQLYICTGTLNVHFN